MRRRGWEKRDGESRTRNREEEKRGREEREARDAENDQEEEESTLNPCSSFAQLGAQTASGAPAKLLPPAALIKIHFRTKVPRTYSLPFLDVPRTCSIFLDAYADYVLAFSPSPPSKRSRFSSRQTGLLAQRPLTAIRS